MPKRAERPPPRLVKDPPKAESAFDVWLNRSLHRLYDDVAREPIPDELLKLIEEHDRKK